VALRYHADRRDFPEMPVLRVAAALVSLGRLRAHSTRSSGCANPADLRAARGLGGGAGDFRGRPRTRSLWLGTARRPGKRAPLLFYARLETLIRAQRRLTPPLLDLVRRSYVALAGPRCSERPRVRCSGWFSLRVLAVPTVADGRDVAGGRAQPRFGAGRATARRGSSLRGEHAGRRRRLVPGYVSSGSKRSGIGARLLAGFAAETRRRSIGTRFRIEPGHPRGRARRRLPKPRNRPAAASKEHRPRVVCRRCCRDGNSPDGAGWNPMLGASCSAAASHMDELRPVRSLSRRHAYALLASSGPRPSSPSWVAGLDAEARANRSDAEFSSEASQSVRRSPNASSQEERSQERADDGAQRVRRVEKSPRRAVARPAPKRGCARPPATSRPSARGTPAPAQREPTGATKPAASPSTGVPPSAT